MIMQISLSLAHLKQNIWPLFRTPSPAKLRFYLLEMSKVLLFGSTGSKPTRITKVTWQKFALTALVCQMQNLKQAAKKFCAGKKKMNLFSASSTLLKSKKHTDWPRISSTAAS
jgi:hypothetical protein